MAGPQQPQGGIRLMPQGIASTPQYGMPGQPGMPIQSMGPMPAQGPQKGNGWVNPYTAPLGPGGTRENMFPNGMMTNGPQLQNGVWHNPNGTTAPMHGAPTQQSPKGQGLMPWQHQQAPRQQSPKGAPQAAPQQSGPLGVSMPWSGTNYTNATTNV